MHHLLLSLLLVKNTVVAFKHLFKLEFLKILFLKFFTG